MLIPRQACLGLIEALFLVAVTVALFNAFRGKLASASLKRVNLFAHIGTASGIPRQACLGLIEAPVV